MRVKVIKSSKQYPYAAPTAYAHSINQEIIEFLFKLLLKNQIRLKDIPQELRILHDCIYIGAFRASRDISKERYIEDLQILEKDIKSVKGLTQKSLQSTWKDYTAFLDFI